MLQINIFLDEGSKCWLIINISRATKSQKYFLAVTAGNLQLGRRSDVATPPSEPASPRGQSEGRPDAGGQAAGLRVGHEPVWLEHEGGQQQVLKLKIIEKD